MTLTAFETYLFGGNRAHFVKAFDYTDEQITLTVAPVDGPRNTTADVTATFLGAVMTWQDSDEVREWPLDIIGFDCKALGSRWKFVLTCDAVEWIWESAWPCVSRQSPTST